MTNKEYFEWQSKRMKDECGENVSVGEIEEYFNNPNRETDVVSLESENIADALIALINSENCTATDVAERTGLPVQLIHQIERKKMRFVLLSDNVQIASAFDRKVELKIVPLKNKN